MGEDKKSSWPTSPEAGVGGLDKEAVEGMAQRQAALDTALFTAVELLAVIADELRKIRCKLTDEEYEPLFEDVDDEKEGELLDETPASVAAPPIASNLESDDEVAEYYKNELLDVLPEESVAKIRPQIEVLIEENRALLKHGWLGDDWGAVSELMRGLGGEWVRDGANSHWILPVP